MTRQTAGSAVPTRLAPVHVLLGVLLLLVVATGIMLFTVIGRKGPEDPQVGAAVRDLVARQLALLRAGDVEGLRATFTEEVCGLVTEAYVRSRQAVYANVAVESLVGHVQANRHKEEDAASEADVYTPEGVLLSRFYRVRADGSWQASTLWFR